MAKMRGRQRRHSGLVGIAEIARLARQHVAARQELQGRRIGGFFGLDEHFLGPSAPQGRGGAWNGSKDRKWAPHARVKLFRPPLPLPSPRSRACASGPSGSR